MNEQNANGLGRPNGAQQNATGQQAYYNSPPGAYGQPYYALPNAPITPPVTGNPGYDYTPISMWGYFGYNLLFAIPLVGFIVILVLSFGAGRNINLRNYARSQFCVWILIFFLAMIVFGIAFGGLGLTRFMF